MTRPIEGRASITLDPITVAPVRVVDAYLAIADAIVPSLELLRASHAPAIPGALLAGHAMECLLKAVLAHNRVSDAELKSKALRHDLAGLWQRSAQFMSTLSTAVPGWAQLLSRLHNAPYELRYPLGVHGLVLPNSAEMVKELSRLLLEVREHVRNVG